MLTEKEFDPSTLWPRAPFEPDFNPTSAQSMSAIPQPLDHGRLEVQDGVWRICMVGGSGAGYGWVDFDPAVHMGIANLAARYPRKPGTWQRPGDEAGGSWCYGNHANLHDEYTACFKIVYGRDPGTGGAPPWEIKDVEYSRALWGALQKAFQDKTGFVPGHPETAPGADTPGLKPPAKGPTATPDQPATPPAVTPPVTPPTPGDPGSWATSALARIADATTTAAQKLEKLGFDKRGGGQVASALRALVAAIDKEI